MRRGLMCSWKFSLIVKASVIIGMLLLGLYLRPSTVCKATEVGPAWVVAVEYYEEQIVVWNNGNTKIYYMTEDNFPRNTSIKNVSQNAWDVLDADPGLYTVIDYSWLPSNKATGMVIKGDLDPTITLVTPAIPMKLSVSMDYFEMERLEPTDTIGALVNITTSPVIKGVTIVDERPVTFDDLEWRKGTSGAWVSTQSLTKAELDSLMAEGAYIYFRIRALDDFVDMTYDGIPVDLNEDRKNGIPGGIRKYDNEDLINFQFDNYTDGYLGYFGRRFSNAVKVKLPKRADPSVYNIDGTKLTVPLTYGREYRVTAGGSTSDWVRVDDTTTKTIPLRAILNLPDIDGSTANNAFPAMTLEIRKFATVKAGPSDITEIVLKEQRRLSQSLVKNKKPTAEDDPNNIYVYYIGDMYTVIKIPGASASLPYEYCFIEGGGNIDFTATKWTAITSASEVKISSSTAHEGVILCIRQKEIKAKAATKTSGAVEYQLPSTYVMYQLDYPSMPKVEANAIFYLRYYEVLVPSFQVVLNEVGKVPYETGIASIKLETASIAFTTETTTTEGVQTMKVTLDKDSMDKLSKCTSKPLTIKFKNGTTDTTSIKLTVEYPTPAGSLTVKTAKGTEKGTTAFTITTPKGGDNFKWYYTISDKSISGLYLLDTFTDIVAKNDLESVSLDTNTATVSVTASWYLTVYEVNDSGYIEKYKCIKIIKDMIK